MRTENVNIPMRDGVMGAHIAWPDKTPAGAIIAIMEIWGVNDTMRRSSPRRASSVWCLICSGARNQG